MKKIILTLIASLSLFKAHAIERLNEEYLISYGDPNARVQVVHYFSFLCPNCISLFQREFSEIKAKFLDTKKVHWIFHPVPMDVLTFQGMVCLQKLTPKEKRIFLEAILEETALEDPTLSAIMMEKAMEVFNKPIPNLQDKTYLSSIPAFKDAYSFVTQQEKILAIPTVEINGKLYSKDIPEVEFIELKLKELGEVKDES
ncbi:thioredoxin domain-containing protein [Candidatus Protochlamydia phocaeensis]|uniref:thioredoxin domain-containing protein n=1 Tax=Candidatus Protochlamydia phocaeensis TaxID=1414722 RepID=UPI0008380A05|nr:thioredoxin domain-containing protein [Candidatus Protochlamydia phocaeensis]